MIPLYRADPYLQSVTTIIDRVLKTEEGVAVFCREALFMEGGGQPMDHGVITIGTQAFPLLKIIKEKGNTGYLISTEAQIEKGKEVCCELNFERRYNIMKLHSAQHALAGALRILRKEILTGGMKIADSANACTVLYPTASALTDKDLLEAQSLLGSLIKEDKVITSQSVHSEAEAIELYGDMYRPTVASGSLKGSVRLIVIDGVDANACGGTHVKSLKEVSGIEITSVTDIPEGRELTFRLSPQ